MKIPKSLAKVVEGFERLPGIGPKSAQRLAFYLLHVPQEYLDEFGTNLSELKKNVEICKTCYNIGDTEVCVVCSDPLRDQAVICIVEDALDVIAIEKSGKFSGVYHVLHGVVDPLNGLGPNDIYIPQLLERIRGSVYSNTEIASQEENARNDNSIQEIILATNPTMEGEATAMYIMREVQKINSAIRITRIGRGLPTGADIEYADELTLARALEGRREY